MLNSLTSEGLYSAVAAAKKEKLTIEDSGHMASLQHSLSNTVGRVRDFVTEK